MEHAMVSRNERLQWESNQLDLYLSSCPADTKGYRLVEITDRRGSPPDWYLFTYRCRGLIRDARTQQIGIAINHQVEFRLGQDYPFSSPTIWVTSPILHPNIGDGTSGGYVCLAETYHPETALVELVWQVGEMIRLAKYWEVPSTRFVYQELQQFRDQLPVDPRSFPVPHSGRPPLVERSLLKEDLKTGTGLVSRDSHVRPAPESNSQPASWELPLQPTDGRPIDRETPAAETAVPRAFDADSVPRFLAQVKAANLGVFDFSTESSSSQEHFYTLRFSLETFAPAMSASGSQVYVRTKYNEAQLRVPIDLSKEHPSVTWLTPIFHPYLGKGTEIRVSVTRAGEPEIVTLFEMLVQALAYRAVAGLEVKNEQALEWVRLNEARVDWLRRSNPSFNLVRGG